MPTKKKRVGFIPRNDVYDIVNKLSIESNLSNSKIINMLVEEALYKRGFLDNINSYSKDIDEYTLDSEIYSKFLLFLQFQEKMKKRQS